MPSLSLPSWQWLPALLIGLICLALPLPLAVGALGGLAVLAAVLSQPLVGVVLALFLGPLGAWEKIFVGGPIAAITTGQLMLMLTTAAWIGRNLLRGKLVLPRTPLNAPLLLFLLVATFSLWNATAPGDGINELIKWLQMLLVLWIVLDLAREYPLPRVIGATLAVLIGVGVVQGVWGIWQFVLRGTGPGHFRIMEGLYRATGSFQQPNPFGGFLALALCLAVGVIIGRIGQNLAHTPLTSRALLHTLRSDRLLLLVLAAAGLIFLGLIGSWSRGAWLNFLFGMGVLAFFLPRRTGRGLALISALAAAGLLIQALGLAPEAVSDRLIGFVDDFNLENVRTAAITPQNYAVMERLAHWEAALGMARSDLWTGVGFGNFNARYDEFRLPYWQEALGHAHNYYLNLLAETGLFGLLAYLLLWGVIFWQTWRVTRVQEPLARGVALGLLAGWSGMTFHHLLDNLYVNNMGIYFGVLFALLFMLQFATGLRKTGPNRPIR
jgi:O-antigen ligase